MKAVILAALSAGLLAVSTSATAGEIKGPPPDSNLDPAPRLSNGNSRCSFSGLNDTPDGAPELLDPGGIAQSFGYFQAHPGELETWHASDPDQRSQFLFPGVGCNPTRSGGLHP